MPENTLTLSHCRFSAGLPLWLLFEALSEKPIIIAQSIYENVEEDAQTVMIPMAAYTRVSQQLKGHANSIWSCKPFVYACLGSISLQGEPNEYLILIFKRLRCEV